MKLAIISDTHFGDDTSQLATTAGLNRPVFALFAAAAGERNDYLVLLGDIFDFSVADYAKAYQIAKNFFVAVKQANLAREIVYLPGNHDFSFWHIVMHQANVINRIAAGLTPKRRWVVPAVLDARPDTADPEVTLVGVDVNRARAKGRADEPKYGGLFLDRLSGARRADRLVFNIAFPNLYVIAPGGETTLLTHGQYFDPYWSFTMTLAREILKSDLALGGGPDPDVEDIVAVNFPLNELASAGLGQAGPLTANVREIQAMAKAGRTRDLEVYLHRARDYADRSITFPGWWGAVKERISDECLNGARDAVLDIVRRSGQDQGPRGNESFLRDPSVRANLRTYLRAGQLEMRSLREQHRLDVPDVTRLVFGHTHIPTPIGPTAEGPASPVIRFECTGKTIAVHNTGGWLRSEAETAAGRPIGASIIRFDSEALTRWSSVEL